MISLILIKHENEQKKEEIEVPGHLFHAIGKHKLDYAYADKFNFTRGFLKNLAIDNPKIHIHHSASFSKNAAEGHHRGVLSKIILSMFHPDRSHEHQKADEKYTNIKAVSYFKAIIEPKLKRGKNVLILADSSSVCSIVNYLEHEGENIILETDVIDWEPRIYFFDHKLNILKVTSGN